MILTEIKHLNVRISEFEEPIFDKNILPVFITPLILKEVEARKKSKHKIETLNPEKKLTFKVVSFKEIVEELAARINKIAIDLEPHYFIDPSYYNSLPYEVKSNLNKITLKDEKKVIADASYRIASSTLRGKKHILYARYRVKVSRYGYWMAYKTIYRYKKKNNISSYSKAANVKGRNIKPILKKKNINKYRKLNFFPVTLHSVLSPSLQKENTESITNLIKQPLSNNVVSEDPNIILTLPVDTAASTPKPSLPVKEKEPLLSKEGRVRTQSLVEQNKMQQSVNNQLLFSGWAPTSKGALMLLEDEGWDLDLLSNKNRVSQRLKKIKPYSLRKLQRLRRLRRLRLMSINLYLHRSGNSNNKIKNNFTSATISPLPRHSKITSSLSLTQKHRVKNESLTNKIEMLRSFGKSSATPVHLQLPTHRVVELESQDRNNSNIYKINNKYLIKRNSNKLNFIINWIGNNFSYNGSIVPNSYSSEQSQFSTSIKTGITSLTDLTQTSLPSNLSYNLDAAADKETRQQAIFKLLGKIKTGGAALAQHWVQPFVQQDRSSEAQNWTQILNKKNISEIFLIQKKKPIKLPTLEELELPDFSLNKNKTLAQVAKFKATKEKTKEKAKLYFKNSQRVKFNPRLYNFFKKKKWKSKNSFDNSLEVGYSKPYLKYNSFAVQNGRENLNSSVTIRTEGPASSLKSSAYAKQQKQEWRNIHTSATNFQPNFYLQRTAKAFEDIKTCMPAEPSRRAVYTNMTTNLAERSNFVISKLGNYNSYSFSNFYGRKATLAQNQNKANFTSCLTAIKSKVRNWKKKKKLSVVLLQKTSQRYVKLQMLNNNLFSDTNISINRKEMMDNYTKNLNIKNLNKFKNLAKVNQPEAWDNITTLLNSALCTPLTDKGQIWASPHEVTTLKKKRTLRSFGRTNQSKSHSYKRNTRLFWAIIKLYSSSFNPIFNSLNNKYLSLPLNKSTAQIKIFKINNPLSPNELTDTNPIEDHGNTFNTRHSALDYLLYQPKFNLSAYPTSALFNSHEARQQSNPQPYSRTIGRALLQGLRSNPIPATNYGLSPATQILTDNKAGSLRLGRIRNTQFKLGGKSSGINNSKISGLIVQQHPSVQTGSSSTQTVKFKAKSIRFNLPYNSTNFVASSLLTDNKRFLFLYFIVPIFFSILKNRINTEGGIHSQSSTPANSSFSLAFNQRDKSGWVSESKIERKLKNLSAAPAEKLFILPTSFLYVPALSGNLGTINNNKTQRESQQATSLKKIKKKNKDPKVLSLTTKRIGAEKRIKNSFIKQKKQIHALIILMLNSNSALLRSRQWVRRLRNRTLLTRDSLARFKLIKNFISKKINIDILRWKSTDLLKWSISLIARSLAPLKRKDEYYGLIFNKILKTKGFFNLNKTKKTKTTYVKNEDIELVTFEPSRPTLSFQLASRAVTEKNASNRDLPTSVKDYDSKASKTSETTATSTSNTEKESYKIKMLKKGVNLDAILNPKKYIGRDIVKNRPKPKILDILNQEITKSILNSSGISTINNLAPNQLSSSAGYNKEFVDTQPAEPSFTNNNFAGATPFISSPASTHSQISAVQVRGEGGQVKKGKLKPESVAVTDLNTNKIPLITYYPGGRYLNDWKRITKLIWQEQYKFNAVYRRSQKSLKLTAINTNKNFKNKFTIIILLKLWNIIKITSIKSVASLKLQGYFIKYGFAKEDRILSTKSYSLKNIKYSNNIFKQKGLYITCRGQIKKLNIIKYKIIKLILSVIETMQINNRARLLSIRYNQLCVAGKVRNKVNIKYDNLNSWLYSNDGSYLLEITENLIAILIKQHFSFMFHNNFLPLIKLNIFLKQHEATNSTNLNNNLNLLIKYLDNLVPPIFSIRKFNSFNKLGFLSKKISLPYMLPQSVQGKKLPEFINSALLSPSRDVGNTAGEKQLLDIVGVQRTAELNLKHKDLAINKFTSIQNIEFNKNYNNLVNAKLAIIGKIRSIKLVELLDKIKEAKIKAEELASLKRVADITNLNLKNKKIYRLFNSSKKLKKKKILLSNRIKVLQTIETIKTDFTFESKLDSNVLSKIPVSLLYYSNLQPVTNSEATSTIKTVRSGSASSLPSLLPTILREGAQVQNTQHSIRQQNNVVVSTETPPVISSYLRELSIYNRETKGIINYFSKFISYNFNANNNKINSSITDLLEASFKVMHCLISKPVFVITPEKVTIQLFYFLMVANKKKIKLIRKKLRSRFNNKGKQRIYKIYKKKRLIEAKNLNLYKLNEVFSEQFELLCSRLNKIFNKPVELNLIRLHYPAEDSNILANFMDILINKVTLAKIYKKLFKGTIIKTLITLKKRKYNDITIIPAFLTGLNIKIAGRIMTQKVKPRKTINLKHRGATASGKINYLNFARLTNKNKRGSYSITISAGQNYFK